LIGPTLPAASNVSLEAFARPLPQARLRVGARIDHLHAERNELVAKLQGLAAADTLESYEAAAQAATALRANMRNESSASHMFQARQRPLDPFASRAIIRL